VEEGAPRGKHTTRPTVPLLIWLRLARIFQTAEQFSGENLRSWSLSNAQFDLLAQVGIAEGLTQQDLATALLVTKGNVCQLVDRMERDGLIRRLPAGRSNRLFLTDAGRRLYEEVVPVHETAMHGLFSQIADQDQAQLVPLLRRLDHTLRDLKSPGENA
jgi:DNA-binding MarR family transcriptional regulator